MRPPRAARIASLAAAIVVAASTLAAGAESAAEPAAEPSPGLSPRDVVEAQLAAFKRNDEPHPDDGIRVAFRFASPQNRLVTGPIERFIEMLKAPTYRSLLNHRVASISETTLRDDLARIKVTLVDAEGHTNAFVWILRRQSEPPCVGCWLTDVVMRVDVANSAPLALAAEPAR